MTAPGDDPLSLGKVSREVLAAYRRRWMLLVTAAVVVLLPQALADAFLDGLRVAGVRSAQDVVLLAAVPLTVAVNLGGQALYTGFAAAAVVEGRGARTMPGVMALARSLPLGRLVLVDLIISVGAAAGFTLLFVPGLLVLAYFGIAPALIKIEHLGVLDSLRRSVELVRGEFWRVLAIVAGTIVVTEAIAQGISSAFHGLVAVTLVDLAADALVQPVEGLTVVVVALALLEQRGEAPAPGAFATSLAGEAE
ncbi:MAG: hypothetical protein ACJ75Z_08370 [Solirubrobacterales bacterium]